MQEKDTKKKLSAEELEKRAAPLSLQYSEPAEGGGGTSTSPLPEEDGGDTGIGRQGQPQAEEP